ncbi:MAG: ABC transporter substrate-binding protein [Candidatus Thermoplasmatota archaeon]|nr:ABC transporter substrate-binding protein [Candidatus Thermoplasmatota archaeon]
MKNKAVLAGVVMALMVLSAFAALPAKTVSAAAADEDVLYIAMQLDMPDFNYYNLGSNSIWKSNVIGMGYEALSTADFDLRPTPLLAESWTFNEATLKVDIYLREGVLFHDGEEMKADDVLFSYLMARDGTTYSSNLIPAFDDDGDNVVSETELNDGVKVISDYHLEMYMVGEGYGQFFSSTLGIPIMPKHIWENYVDDDNRVIVEVSEQEMATGTGPWYYADGVTDSYRVMQKFDDYWGVNFTTPAGMPVFPKVVDTLFYKIYTSIDTAILALQGGEVDYIAWAVTAGRVPALQSDPNIELEYMSDAGYFYMAFNLKKEPMNNISFRKAVSHLIDKDQLVDVYMGGFGMAGSAAVSPFFDEWHNPTVTTYAFNIDAANDLLDAAGYLDDNGDGWRDMPDGTLMEKITLLTPPADYDPIRIRAGQMIATNMRDAGINVEAKPIDFNTLVAKLYSFDYQMLIIGWAFSGYTECVSVLYDIYGSSAASNTWAFWSDTNPHPDYSDIGGVSTLADERTMELVDEFTVLEEDARASFDVAEQIDLVKRGQAIIADAVPCNILYYRVNVEAHGNVWTNWTQFDGTLMNTFNMCTLEYSGAGSATGGGVVTTSLSAGLTITEKVKCDQSVDAYVKAIDNLGNPVAGATVEVNVTSGATATPVSGTTDADGVFEFSVAGEAVGVSAVNVTVTSDTLNATDSSSLIVTSLGGIGVEVIPAKTVLDPAETTEVSVRVTDVNGDPVEGATVTIDPYLLGYGSISPSELLTNAAGEGTMTYTAPAEDLANQHMLVTLAASVEHDKYALSNLASSVIVVYNDVAPDWYVTAIESVTTTALSDSSPTTTIEVLATDAAGNPLDSEELDVTYSADIVVSPVPTVTTDGSGLASFDVTIDNTIDTDTALRVTIGKGGVANTIVDTVTLTYSEAGDLTDMYGGYVQYATTKFVDALDTFDVDFYVFDSQGTPANVSASVVVAGTAYGQLTDWDGTEYNSLYDYAGMMILTEGDDQNIVTSGSYSAPEYIDDWVWDSAADDYVPLNISGVEVVNGTYSLTLVGEDLVHVDLGIDLFLVPNSTADFNFVSWNHEIYGETTLSSEYGYARAYGLTTVRYDIAKPVLEAKSAEFDVTAVTVTAYDEDNALVEGAEVSLYPAGDYGVTTENSTTDATGKAIFEITAAAENPYTEEFEDVTWETNPDMYVVAEVSGAMNIFSQTQLVVETMRDSVFFELEPMLEVYRIGDQLHITATVVDDTGEPYPDLPVTIATGAGTVVTPTVLTDGDGIATMVVDTSNIEDAPAALVAISLATGGAPEGTTAKMMVAMENSGPEIGITSPATDGEVVGPDATVTAAVYDNNGIATVTLKVDEEDSVNVNLTAGSVAAAISEVLEDVGDGEHTVTIVATDSLGISSEEEVTFTVVKAVSSTLAWVVAALGWIIAVVALILVVKYKPKKEIETGLVEAPEDEPVLEPERLEEEKTE